MCVLQHERATRRRRTEIPPFLGPVCFALGEDAGRMDMEEQDGKPDRKRIAKKAV